MARNAGGTYSLPSPGLAVSGQTASSTANNNVFNDVATELTDSLNRSGKGAMLAALAMGNFKVTGMANGTATTDAAALGQLPGGVIVACSDDVSALTTGTGKATFRMPYALTVTAVRASLKTAQTSGTIFTVDINDGGTTILSTKLTIDNGEKTSVTAATAAVISDTALASDAEITIDIDQVGDGTAIGLKVAIIGYPT